VSDGSEILALTLVFVVHVIGGLLLVWALLGDEARAGWRRRWRRGGEDPHGPPDGPPPARAIPPLPLSESMPSRARLREPGRAGGAYPRPARRPAHPPAPAAVPERPARRHAPPA
jgi:hypothetical protein